MALGIGVLTSLFSVINGVMLRPLPYSDPDRLMVIEEVIDRIPGRHISVVAAKVPDWQQRNHSFEQLIGMYRPGNLVLRTEKRIEPARLACVSSGYFEMLGVTLARGRSFRPAERLANGSLPVVIAHDAWERLFAGADDVVGKTFRLGGKVATVVGVTPASFRPMIAAELWAPFASFPHEHWSDRGAHMTNAFARLRPGVSRAEAEADMNRIAAELADEHPFTDRGFSVAVTPLRARAARDVREPLLMLLGAVACLLLIACANVANLLLVRATAREHELGVRTALGASPGRLARQLLIESVLLSLAGAAVGLVVAMWGTDLLVWLSPSGLPLVDDVVVDRRVLGFTVVVAVLSGLGFGTVPAIFTARRNLSEILKDGVTRSSAGPRSRAVRSTLVVVEVALAVILLIAAGLLINSLYRLQSQDPGFDHRRLVTAEIVLPGRGYEGTEQRVAFHDGLVAKARALDSVSAAATIDPLPLSGRDRAFYFSLREKPPAVESDWPITGHRLVGEGYFAMMGIPVVKGRELTAADTADSKPVALVNESFVRMVLRGADPIGRTIVFSDRDRVRRTIVGVVGDVRHRGLDHRPLPEIYEAYVQRPFANMILAVRAKSDVELVRRQINALVRSLDPDVAVSVRTMSEHIEMSVESRRFRALLLGIFALVALVLAAMGIYGVISYTVRERVQEIGIRMVLGARRSDVLRLVLGTGLRLALVGIAVGLGLALLLAHAIRDLLFEVSPADPLTYIGVAVLLTLVAMVATYVPASRATRVDPVIALRP
jgi:putative ABC transport system permease protein